jgi:lysozyme
MTTVQEGSIFLAAALCRHFEGLYLRPYLCPAGVPTISYGSTRYENGVRVQLGDLPITRQRAEAMLLHELSKIQPTVLKLCPGLDAWGPGSLAAILDFAFNLGTGNLQASTLRKKINANDVGGAKQELQKWVRGGGKVLPGLVRRRVAEAALLG